MPYCPKCGSKVTEEMKYCPKCGASLKPETISKEEAYEKHEKQEKEEKKEKEEKGEKAEKHEKGEANRFWMLIGGLILVVFGLLSLLTIFLGISEPLRGAFFLVIVGVLIVVFAVYGAIKASRRSPVP